MGAGNCLRPTPSFKHFELKAGIPLTKPDLEGRSRPDSRLSSLLWARAGQSIITYKALGGGTASGQGTFAYGISRPARPAAITLTEAA